MPAAAVDLFPNRALQGMTMSGADTLSFEQIRFSVGLFEGIAIVVHKIAYYPQLATLILMVANTDYIIMGLTTRDDLSSILATNQNVIDTRMINPVIVGSVVGINHIETPFVSDFSTMPGGGMIIPANPLYLAMDSGGLGSAGVMRAIIYYTFKKLTDKDYLELLQTMVPANV